MQILDVSSLNNVLVSQELLQICIGQFHVSLNFTNHVKISIECAFKIHSEKFSLDATAEDPNSSKELICLLGNSIESCNYVQDSILEIVFLNNLKLLLLSNLDGTESYAIQNDMVEYIA
ncbi:hypothetical protein Lepto7375DRAFT_2211 [Leptolyngbya sp. PCC 7375]|nr:hypothetical protein Lepto7375DRAFT_2211 [Leptolyngbya sp. PCC 7375]